jgi:hypothetical protein
VRVRATDALKVTTPAPNRGGRPTGSAESEESQRLSRLFNVVLKEAGFNSQREFAEYLKRSHQCVNRWACGHKPLPHEVKLILALRKVALAAALGVE